MFYKIMYALYIPFFNFIQFCFKINYSSVIVIQKNRSFGMKNDTNQKMRCIMHTGSSRRIIYCDTPIKKNGWETASEIQVQTSARLVILLQISGDDSQLSDYAFYFLRI